MQNLIEFLIPAYKRFDGVVAAARSVAKQVSKHRYEGVVNITVVDDASPEFTMEDLTFCLGDMAGLVRIKSNFCNKGMSQNIFDMVAESKSEFCTVLTDDDWLVDGKLAEIVDYLLFISDKKEVGGLFTPRYSYLESGELHCVACRPYARDCLIKNGPASAMRFCHNGFILTGFFFRPAYVPKNEWCQNIENGYFPVINFGFILARYSLLFVDRKWFHHTVLNECHWESWGPDQFSQRKRLYRDYMDAVCVLAQSFMTGDISILNYVAVSWHEFINYLLQFGAVNLPLFDRIGSVSRRTRRRLAFSAGIVLYPIYLPFELCRRIGWSLIYRSRRVLSALKIN